MNVPAIMPGGRKHFNIYLAIIAMAWCTGCATAPPEKDVASREEEPEEQLTALRLHLQADPSPGQPGKTMEVPIYRNRPTLLTVSATALMSEHYVAAAKLMDEDDTFAIQVEFDRKGRWILEAVTAQNRGRRLAVFCSFGKERWLAAPIIQQVISDGKLTFTPDATREEAIRIVRGLNNAAKKMEHDPRF